MIADKIQKHLNSIETEKQVKIILAVESGSRAWGFESQDSDYDVRFIYARPLLDYLRIAGVHRDTIESTPEALMDLAGWDVGKALQLYAKSNPAMIEWLLSPVSYIQRHPIFDVMQDNIKLCYDAKAGFMHHGSLAHNTMKRHVQESDGQIKAKKLLYILRSLASMQYIYEHGYVDTIVASELIRACKDQASYAQAMDELIIVKQQTESSCVSTDSEIVRWITQEYKHWNHVDLLRNLPKSIMPPQEKIDLTNRLFLRAIWPNIPG